MKTNRQSFSGTRPIFTGSPAIVPGGFDLDKVNQSFTVGQSIPAGTLAIYDETTRLVKILKTAKVKAIDADNAKIVTLETDENYEPLFVVGEKVLKTVAGTYADAPSISAISNTDAGYVVTLSAEIAGLAVGDILQQVVEDAAHNAALIGTPNSLVLSERYVGQYEVGIDVTHDTMQYAVFERRILPIPDALKENGMLKANPHIRLSQSY
jgi:hypothetical protein